MDYQEFLTRIVDDAARGAREDYAKSPHKLEGSVAGLEACRGRTPAELREILDVARGATRASLRAGDPPQTYWRVRCYEAEVEWVCNCVSALLVNAGRAPIVPPTARAVFKAASLAGVADRRRSSLN